MKIIKLVMPITLMLLFSTTAGAESVRCGDHVFEDGELQNQVTMEEVLEKCGEPSSREISTLYYNEKGVRFDFDAEGKLMSINEIDEDDSPRD